MLQGDGQGSACAALTVSEGTRGVSISFSPLKLENPDLFGVRLTGAVGRTGKQRLQDLTSRCLEKGKTRLVIEISGLKAIGGGGSAILAAFQSQLIAREGEVVFVGAGSVVRRFMRQSFAELPLRFFTDVPSAVSGFFSGAGQDLEDNQDPGERAGDEASSSSAGEATGAGSELAGSEDAAVDTEPMGAVCLSATLEDEPDSALDELLGDFPLLDEKPQPVATPAPSPAREATESGSRTPRSRRVASTPGAPTPSGAREATRHHFLSLADAVTAIRAAPNASDLAEPLFDLLQSHDLATRLIYCSRQGEQLRSADGEHSFAAAGPLASMLLAAERPLSLLDIDEDELKDDETGLLAEAGPDLILPVVWAGDLQAAAFLKNGKNGSEYGVIDNFALELLMRVLGERGEPSSSTRVATAPDAAACRAAATEPDEELAGRLRRTEILLDLTKQLPQATSASELWEQIFAVLNRELGVSSLAVVPADSDDLVTDVRLGEAAGKGRFPNPGQRKVRAFFEMLDLPVPVQELPSGRDFVRSALHKAGLTWAAPLRSGRRLLGIVLVGVSADHDRPALDAELLGCLLDEAVTAQTNLAARRCQNTANQGLVKTLVSLVEERHYGTRVLTEQVVELVRQVARELDLPASQEEDLVYGALLRDIGMIPLGDLVLHSPHKLSAEQWDQLRGHPETGVRLLESLPVSQTIKDIVLLHHERFNGEGYPRGLKGQDIPLVARIVAAVENHVAMVTDLPNRKALPRDEAMGILRENWGERYDPDIVEVLLRVLEGPENPQCHG